MLIGGMGVDGGWVGGFASVCCSVGVPTGVGGKAERDCTCR